MDQGKPSRALHQQSGAMDRRFVGMIADHIDLLLAVTTVGIGLWAILSSEYAYLPALAIAGAVSFFIGFIASLGVSAIVEILYLVQTIRGHQFVDAAVVMVEVFGYGCVAWLGYRHREQQRLQKEMAMQAAHTDSVMPWVVANEVRTSLAAIRFLLFPLHTSERAQTDSDPLRQATDELQRLEQIFTNMEKNVASTNSRKI